MAHVGPVGSAFRGTGRGQAGCGAVLRFSATARIALPTDPWNMPTDLILIDTDSGTASAAYVVRGSGQSGGTSGGMCAPDDCGPVRPRWRGHAASGQQDMCGAADISRSGRKTLVSCAGDRGVYGGAHRCRQAEARESRALRPCKRLLVYPGGRVVAWRGHLA